MVKYTGRGLVVKRPGVLSKVQMLNLVLGVGVFSLLPNRFLEGRPPSEGLFCHSFLEGTHLQVLLCNRGRLRQDSEIAEG